MEGQEEGKFQISLAAARVNAKLTQADVAKKLHISKRTIVNWEGGKVKPSKIVVHALCELYSIPLKNLDI